MLLWQPLHIHGVYDYVHIRCPTSSDASVVMAMISCTCSIKLCLMKL